MENKVYAKPIYKCSLCGTVHDDVVSRAHCEIYCNNKRLEKEQKAAEEKKKAEYQSRLSEVDAAFDKAYDLKDKFVKDYGAYMYSRDVCNKFAHDNVFNWFGL